MKYNVFISSNMDEFKEERKAIVESIKSDYALNDFFKIFIFENTPSSSQSPDTTWKQNVLESDIYIGLIGSNYGTILESGLSPTETEYDLFHQKSNEAYIFIKNVDKRDSKVEKFIDKIKLDHTYTSFEDKNILTDKIKQSLTVFLHNKIDDTDFDEQLIQYSTSQDIDYTAYDLYFKSVIDNRLKPINEEKTREEMLELINAGKIENGEFHFNNAGALFFAKDIQKFNIAHEIKMARFKNGTRKDILDRKVSYNSLISLLDDVYLFFNRNIKNSSVIVGMNRVDLDEYPFEVVREAIINAVAHRDYKITSAPITFYIYDDRIEIISPGTLLPPLTLDTLVSGNPMHRNKLLCDIFSKTKFMEHYGTGIQRMNDRMREEGLKEPEFEEFGGFFKVTLWARDENTINPDLYKHNKENLKDLGLNNNQIKALTLITNENKLYTISKYMDEFAVSRQTAVNHLNKLIELGFVKKSKQGRINIYSKY